MKSLITIDKWKLVDVKEARKIKGDLSRFSFMVSLIWHQCDAVNFEYEGRSMNPVVCFLDSEDAVQGKCYYCMEKIPNDLHSIWTIHNFNIISKLDLNDNNSWRAEIVSKRLKSIEGFKKKGREEGWYDG